MNQIVDFKVRNDGPKVVLIFLDSEGNEVQRVTMSWINGVRLEREAHMAVEFGLVALDNMIHAGKLAKSSKMATTLQSFADKNEKVLQELAKR